MELIYAFMDQSGMWYGDPEAEILWATPREGELTYEPCTGSEGASSPFAGQRLRVRYADIDGTPGPVPYQMDSGDTYYPTWAVYELLADPFEPPNSGSDEGFVVWRIELSENGNHYDVITRPASNNLLHVEILGADSDGQRIASLTGVVIPGQMASLGRLLRTAAEFHTETSTASDLAPPPSPRYPNWRAPWTDEEAARLITAHQAGWDIEQIAKAHGRTASAISWRLFQQGLGPYPGSPTPPRTQAPQSPREYTRTYSLEDLRKIHANSHKPWTPEDDARLARRRAEGATIAQLMDEFGRNENAIITRLARINSGRGNQ